MERSYLPTLEIDLLNETSVGIMLRIANYGNGDDYVTLEVGDMAEGVDVRVSPLAFHLEWSTSQGVTVTFTVPSSMTPGLYHLRLNASSSDEGEHVRSILLELRIKAVYQKGDFADLAYSDESDDDYLLVITSKGADGKVLESKSRVNQSASVDILHLEARHDHSTGTVTVTLILSDGALVEPTTEYWVFFVNRSHRQVGPLLSPENHASGTFEWNFSDPRRTICDIHYIDGEVGSTSALHGLVAEVDGAILTITVPSRELRRIGLEPGSGFGLYAYAHTKVVAVDGEHTLRVDWDSAGVGAATAPDDFTNKREDTPLPGLLALIALVLAALVVVVARRDHLWRTSVLD